MIEARLLVQLLVAWEQSSGDVVAFSASLTGENLPAAGRPNSKKSAMYLASAIGLLRARIYPSIELYLVTTSLRNPCMESGDLLCRTRASAAAPLQGTRRLS